MVYDVVRMRMRILSSYVETSDLISKVNTHGGESPYTVGHVACKVGIGRSHSIGHTEDRDANHGINTKLHYIFGQEDEG